MAVPLLPAPSETLPKRRNQREKFKGKRTASCPSRLHGLEHNVEFLYCGGRNGKSFLTQLPSLPYKGRHEVRGSFAPVLESLDDEIA